MQANAHPSVMCSPMGPDELNFSTRLHRVRFAVTFKGWPYERHNSLGLDVGVKGLHRIKHVISHQHELSQHHGPG